MKKYAPVIGMLLAATFSSCLKDELPVPRQERVVGGGEGEGGGDGISFRVCMGTGYQDQLWLDIATGTVQNSNPFVAWDLAFESDPDGWRIRLNGAKKMLAFNMGAVDISQPHDTTGLGQYGMIDAPSGDPDSTAIGDWRGTQDVYMIDLGLNHLGQSQGRRKMRFTEVTAGHFTFEVARLDGSQLTTVTVPKDPTRLSTCYKVDAGVVPIEPARGEWDLVVTKYTHQFYDPYMPYLVTGVLSANGVRVAVVPGAELQDVTLADTLAHPFSTARDAIGYDWKYYSFESSSYIVDRTRVYIVQDASGDFFKLRFVDFYSEQGRAGCPMFEVVPL
ncbi:MAG: HmuY family protein [Flavobacteriales bacterium]|nr:HmuY family protein [Flavobacteriales bacterium]